jgi:putative heme-binding domain-containing protein
MLASFAYIDPQYRDTLAAGRFVTSRPTRRCIPRSRSQNWLEDGDDETRRRRLAGLWLALEPRNNVPMPAAWKRVAPRLYASSDVRIRRQAERIAAVLGDDSMFPRLRETLAATGADASSRKHAFAVLSRAHDLASLPVFLQLLGDAEFRALAINLLVRFEDARVAAALIDRFGQFSPADRALALNALTSRGSFALALLDAVSEHRVQRDQLTSFHIRQMSALKNAEVDQRVTAAWGRILQTPFEKQARMEKLEKTFNEAPLWAYDSGAGQQHFQKLCAPCHRIGNEGARIGPELTGAGKNGIRYLIENIIDPDAVIGTDFQMTTVETRAGDVLSGLVVNESASALTLRTITAESVIARSDIVKRETSAKSLMPEGLLEALSPREQLELLKFLATH